MVIASQHIVLQQFHIRTTMTVLQTYCNRPVDHCHADGSEHRRADAARDVGSKSNLEPKLHRVVHPFRGIVEGRKGRGTFSLRNRCPLTSFALCQCSWQQKGERSECYPYFPSHLKQASPRKKLESGQWATDVPLSTRILMSSSVRRVPWAIRLWGKE